MQWLAVIGAAGMAISLILPWYAIELQFDPYIANEFSVGVMGLICLVISLVGMGKGKRLYQIAGLGISVLGLIFSLLTIIMDSAFPLAIGAYVGLIFSIVTLVGFALRLKGVPTA